MAALKDGADAVSTEQLVLQRLHVVLEEATPQVARDRCQTLTKIVWNILQNPTEVRFRSLRKGSKALTTKLGGPSKAALTFLLVLGFEDSGEAYTFPQDADFRPMQVVLDFLQAAFLDLEDKVALLDLHSPAAPDASTSSASASDSVNTVASNEGSVTSPVGASRSSKAGQRSAFAFQPQNRRKGNAAPKLNTSLKSAPDPGDLQELRRLRAERLEVAQASKDAEQHEGIPEEVVVDFYPGETGLLYADGGKVLEAFAGGQACACGIKAGWFITNVADRSVNSGSKEEIADLFKVANAAGRNYPVKFSIKEPKSISASLISWLLNGFTLGWESPPGSGCLAPAKSDVRTLQL